MASILTSALSGTTAAAHSAFATLAAATHVAPGSAVPNVDVKINAPDQKLNFSKLQGKNVIVLVPAAFSPVCSETQVPGYIERYDQFAAKGVKDIYILSVNDVFCMNAWGKKLHGDQTAKVKFVADDSGAFASATGLIFDAQALLGGPRAKRSVLVIEDGKVVHVAVEEDNLKVTVSGAEAALAAL
ncbi:hypothetical protein QFC22_000525 [Naganishia vaughanmartiniae]|uniref:Uncharacterized protein n=1 Tax=Naganishia vaughanmartiniae TaxID=1424756 RepID=A0ACC2XNY5_9TREE|nr:hypothetical protein QFC22_000525 [Naganishia vaughanmartiniae]